MQYHCNKTIAIKRAEEWKKLKKKKEEKSPKNSQRK